jgi:tetratricopeptide (TPR) repeat protein
VTGILIAATIIGVPALAFTLWPLVRRTETSGLLPLPPDPREQLHEHKRTALRALRELEFEHGAGHVSDEDYAELRARYESETAAILTALDRLGADPIVTAGPSSSAGRRARASERGAGPSARRSAWLHPGALAISGVLLLVFGIAIGVGIVRYTAPDPNADMPPPGSRPLAELTPAPGASDAPAAGRPSAGAPMPSSGSATEGGTSRSIPPEIMKGMLEAARQSLMDGRLREAAAAYQAVLKRDPNNIDALTHIAVVLAVSADGAERAQLVDHALGLFDRALAIDPNYPPALFYRGQVLYEAKKDVPEAIRSWEKFVKVAPPGEDRDRVAQLIADAKRSGTPR